MNFPSNNFHQKVKNHSPYIAHKRPHGKQFSIEKLTHYTGEKTSSVTVKAPFLNKSCWGRAEVHKIVAALGWECNERNVNT